jgi:hypothetical protein
MPWVKREDWEIEEPGFIKKLGPSIGIFIFLIIFQITTEKIGYKKYSGTLDPKSWAQVFSHFGRMIMLASIGGFAMWVFPKQLGPKTTECVMCEKCEKAKIVDEQNKCECGGIFYPMRKYKWVE